MARKRQFVWKSGDLVSPDKKEIFPIQVVKKKRRKRRRGNSSVRAGNVAS